MNSIGGLTHGVVLTKQKLFGAWWGFEASAGQAIHFKATAAYNLPHGVWVGANGYLLREVTMPRINGVEIISSPEQVGAIGSRMVWDLGRYLLYVNGYHGVGALNRQEGNKLVLRVQCIPGRHAGIDGPQ